MGGFGIRLRRHGRFLPAILRRHLPFPVVDVPVSHPGIPARKEEDHRQHSHDPDSDRRAAADGVPGQHGSDHERHEEA